MRLPTLATSLHYVFYPNPGQAHYTSTSMISLLALCGALMLLSFILRFWRRGISNPVTRKLSRSWSSASFWFGIAGAILVVSRVEGIQFLAMRFLWGVWLVAALAYLFFQIRQFRARHYEVLPVEVVLDPRDKYLPKKKH